MDFLTAFYAEHSWWLLPVLIFTARIVDVSIGTMRIIFLSRGMKLLAPFCGFFEVFVWLLAIGQIMQNLDSWVNMFAFAGGFCTGNYVGMLIEERLAIGLLSVWVITRNDATELIRELKEAQYGLTRVAARGLHGDVRILILVIRRKNLGGVQRLIEQCQPEAFITIQDIRSVKGGFYPFNDGGLFAWRKSLGLRKGK